MLQRIKLLLQEGNDFSDFLGIDAYSKIHG